MKRKRRQQVRCRLPFGYFGLLSGLSAAPDGPAAAYLLDVFIAVKGKRRLWRSFEGDSPEQLATRATLALWAWAERHIVGVP